METRRCHSTIPPVCEAPRCVRALHRRLPNSEGAMGPIHRRAPSARTQAHQNGRRTHQQTPCSHSEGERPKKATQRQAPYIAKGRATAPVIVVLQRRSRRQSQPQRNHRVQQSSPRLAPRTPSTLLTLRGRDACHKSRPRIFTRKPEARNQRFRESREPSDLASLATQTRIPPKESLMRSRTQCQRKRLI